MIILTDAQEARSPSPYYEIPSWYAAELRRTLGESIMRRTVDLVGPDGRSVPMTVGDTVRVRLPMRTVQEIAEIMQLPTVTTVTDE